MAVFITLPTNAFNHPMQLTILTEEMAPYNFSNEQGKIKGINVDIVKEILELNNIEYTFEIYPWARAFKNAQAINNVGLISTAYTEKRKDMFKWVGPIASSQAYLYKLSHRNDIQIANIEQAKNYTIAIVRNDIYQNLFVAQGFEVGKNLMVFSNTTEYFKLFFEGKIDLVLGSDIVMPFHLFKAGHTTSIVTPLVKIDGAKGNYLALNKSVPDTLVKKLNNSLTAIKQSKRYQKIVNSYRK